jgi:hypothetical protein
VREQTSTSKKETILTSTNQNSEEKTSRQDIYTRVTDKIVADLEQGVRPWMKPWNAEHAAGKITRPLQGRPDSSKTPNVWQSAHDVQGQFPASLNPAVSASCAVSK